MAEDDRPAPDGEEDSGEETREEAFGRLFAYLVEKSETGGVPVGATYKMNFNVPLSGAESRPCQMLLVPYFISDAGKPQLLIISVLSYGSIIQQAAVTSEWDGETPNIVGYSSFEEATEFYFSPTGLVDYAINGIDTYNDNVNNTGGLPLQPPTNNREHLN